MQLNWARVCFVFVAAILLSACGGGGGDSSTTVTEPEQALTLSWFAGSDASSITTRDGVGGEATFDIVFGLVGDAQGNLFASDNNSGNLRKISSDASVTTLAGAGYYFGYQDGLGVPALYSRQLRYITVGASGNVYVVDAHSIRVIGIDQKVKTIGWAYAPGYVDGPAAIARFSYPSGMAEDSSGNLYVADNGNHVIRKITPDGTVSTLAGSGSSGFVNAAGTSAKFNHPTDIAVRHDDVLFVSDSGNNVIRMVTLEGAVSTFSGAGSEGHVNGSATVATFNYPTGLVFDGDGNLIVADSSNHLIRQVSSDGSVTTLAGDGVDREVDGPLFGSSFSWPEGVAIDADGAVLVVTPGSGLRKISGSAVSTVGTYAGMFDVGVTASGEIYFTDYNRNVIRKVLTGGQSEIYSGVLDSEGYQAGNRLGAVFRNPAGVALDSLGNLIVADYGNNVIRRVAPSGLTETIAGNQAVPGFVNGMGVAAQFNGPVAVAVDASDNIYVADAANHVIRKISPSGEVSTFSGSGVAGMSDGSAVTASFRTPGGLALDAAGNLYVSDTGNHAIRKISPDGTVITVAGDGTAGAVDGMGSQARFNYPRGIVVSDAGSVYVADQDNYAVRKLLPNGQVSTVVGTLGVRGNTTGALPGRLLGSYGVAIANGNLYVSVGGGVMKVSGLP